MSTNKNFTGAVRLIAIAASLSCVGSAVFAQATSAPPTLSEIRNIPVVGQTEIEAKLAEERNIRAKAMQEAALSYGARSGLIRRTFDIRGSLEKMEPYMDATFNFTPLMMTDFQAGEVGDKRARMVVPPVIVETGRTFNQQDANLIRIRDKIDRIEANAHFTSSTPNWRKYLLRDLGETKASLPHASLLPRTPEERAQWDKWVEEGYEAGKAQADAIFDSDKARLERDFIGMIRYYELVEQKIVSLPYVATRNDGITGDANQLNINDVTLRITVQPAFQTNPKDWSPVGYK